MKIFEVIDPIHSQLPNFVKFACNHLGINEHPRIDVVTKVPDAEGLTFGAYKPEEKTIYLVSKGRHPKDVFRTLAHELVHSKESRMNDYPVFPEQAEGDDSDYKRNPFSPA